MNAPYRFDPLALAAAPGVGARSESLFAIPTSSKTTIAKKG